MMGKKKQAMKRGGKVKKGKKKQVAKKRGGGMLEMAGGGMMSPRKKNSIWAIGSASIREIERLNILNASLLAMKRAIKKLKVKPNLVLVDGNKSPDLNNYITKTVIKGDQKIKEISAASIVAKVSRDKLILKMSESFKKYKWDSNAGYGTKDHIKAIRKYGITKFHRKTFNPIHNILSLKKK